MRSGRTPAPSPRTRVRRLHENARYDRAAIDAVLDAGLVCHLGFAQDGQPFVIPTLHARIGDWLYVHGSSASRTLRALGGTVPACATVTLLDGLVLARSVFEHSVNYRSVAHAGTVPPSATVTLLDGLVLARSVFEHSVNYRSVVVLGEAADVGDPDEKLAALEAFTEKLLPGRWADARGPTRKELKATAVLRLPLDEASAKIRTGPPDDGDSPDAALDVWAGEIPLVTRAFAPVPDPALRAGIPVPSYARRYRRPGLTG